MFLFLFVPGARWTFNKPAVRAFLEGASVVRVQVWQEAVRLLPGPSEATARAADTEWTMPLHFRARGGAEANFGAALPPEAHAKVVAALSPSLERPYYLLRRDQDGWIRMLHFDEQGDPPRLEPHLRFWSAASGMPQGEPPALQYPDLVREAARVVQEASRRPGRRSADALKAQALLDEFDSLIREIRPELILPPIDPEALRSVIESLSGLLARVEGREVDRLPGPLKRGT